MLSFCFEGRINNPRDVDFSSASDADIVISFHDADFFSASRRTDDLRVLPDGLRVLPSG